MDLESSYAAAERICRSSGSSFFRSFEFLKPERRRAMHTLYAFARIADNATDDAPSDVAWNCSSWLAWLNQCAMPEDARLPAELDAIRPAVIDSIQRFRIPTDMLGHLVHGMDEDSRGCEIRTWEDLHGYAFRVASSMGICCTAIWTDGNPVTPEQPLWRSAVDCGVAFQLTNILRDVREDALRGRVYLPLEDIERFGMQRSRWLDCLTTDQPQSEGFADAASKVIAVQIERARGLFASGWQLHRMLDADSFRMFSLMWQTYRAILRQIERDPLRILKVRVRLSTARKWRLAADHCFTPRLLQVASATDRDAAWIEPEHASAPKFTGPRPSIAVIGGGLAGMNAALHLARHGCKVTLFEAKSRLGGRAGSFLDPVTDQAIDYCQHVGMKCCSELIRWMVETETTSSWRVYDTLHFVSRRGKPLAVNAWPLPAPLHLSGLILGWPDLSILDRLRVAVGLSQLMMTRSTRDFEQMPALAWLRKHFQNERTIDRFWGTILVSALGDQIDRIAMGPVRKVLVDGFAATRDAFHLLVPTVPLSKLMDDAPRTALSALEVDVRCGCAVQKIQRSSSGTWRIQSDGEWDCDAVVIAVPWYRVNSLLRDAELPTSLQQKLEKVARLQASPITGVHTWWDRPWLRQPHAILIDRLCQWVFPGPEAAANQVPQSEMYYQVVISGSHDLPRGDHESILKEVQKDLQELFPDAKDARLVRGRIVTDPHSVFSVSPSHADSRLTSSAFAVEGIMLAGDWVATGWPATMEGALRSGLLAAQSTLSYLGRPAHLIR